MPATVKRTVTTRYTLDAKGALKDLRSIAQTSAATAKGLGRTNESLNRLNKTAQRTESSINRLGKQFGFLKNMVVAWLSYKSLDYFKSISDAATDTEVRLRGLAGQFESAASAADVGGQIFEDLKEQALEVGTGVDTLAETYAKLAYAVPTAEHEELIGVTKTLSDTLAKTGASTQQVNAVLLQMAQGLGTGALQGDEFKSVLENAPALLYAWQEALGKTSVGIKTLSENADLTTESFIELYPEIQRLVEEMTGVEEVPITFGRAFENLRTVLIGLFQDLSGEGSGSVFQPLAEGLNDMALALDKLTPKIKSALGELAVFGPAAQEAGRLALRAFDGMVEGAKAVVEVMVRANVAAIGGSESDPRGNPFHPDYLSNLAMETEKELATIEVLYEYTRDALTVTFTGIWESFKENFGEPIIEFFKDLPRLFKEAMQFVSDLLSAAAKDLLDIWNSEAMEPLRAAFEKIAGFFKEYVIEPIMEMWDVLTGWIAEKWEQFNPFSNGSVDAGTPIAAPGSQFGAAESWAEVAFTAGAKSGWDKVDEQLRAEASRLARDLEAIGIEVTVTSGYRSGSGSSQHNYGNALDWVLSDWEKARDYMRQHGDKYALRFPVKDEGPEDWSARTYGRSKNGTPEHWHVQLDETKARVENFAEAVEETNDKVTELGENAATELKRRWEEIEARHAEAANRPATEGAEAALERIDIGNRKVSASTSELTKATQEQTKAEKSAVKEREKLAKAVEDLRQEYDPLRKLQKDYEAQIKTINRAEADGLITLQEKNTLLQQANDAYRAAKQEGMEEYRKGIESLKSADDARHEAMLKHREELAMLTEAYNKGVIPSLAEFEELVQVSRDRYDQSLATIVAEEAEAAQVKLEEVVGKLYTLQDGYRDLVQNMRSGLEGAFADMFSGSLKSAEDFVKRLGKILLDNLAQIAAKIASQAIIVPIVAAFTGTANAAGGSTGGILSGLFGGNGGVGGILSGIFGGGGSGGGLGGIMTNIGSGIGKLFTSNSIGNSMANFVATNLNASGSSQMLTGFAKGLQGTPNWAFGVGSIAGGIIGGALFSKGYGKTGSTIGATAGAAIGSVVPVIGTIIGGIVGGVAGGWLGSRFGLTKTPKGYAGVQGGMITTGGTAQMQQQAAGANNLLGQLAAFLGPDAQRVLAGENRNPGKLSEEIFGEAVKHWTAKSIDKMVNATTEAWQREKGALGNEMAKVFYDIYRNTDTTSPEKRAAAAQAATKAAAELEYGLMSLAVAFEQVYNVDMQHAMNVVAELYSQLGGELENLLPGFERYLQILESLKTEEELVQRSTNRVSEVFAQFGQTLPTTAEGLTAAIKGVDTTTEAGFRFASALGEIADDIAVYMNSLSGPIEETVDPTVRRNLEIQIMQLEGRELEAIAAVREMELESTTEGLHELMNRIYALQDEQRVLEEQRAARSLEIQIMELEGKTEEALAASRELELSTMDEGLRALMERIYALQDEQRAAEEAQRALEETEASIQRFADAAVNITRGLDATRNDIESFGLSPEELWKKNKAEADALMDALGEMTDPKMIEDTVNKINSLITSGWGSLDDTQREKLKQPFLDYLDEIEAVATERLSVGLAPFLDPDEEYSFEGSMVKFSEMLEALDGSLGASSKGFEESSEAQRAAAREMMNAATEMTNAARSIPTTLTVRVGEGETS